MPYMTPAWMVRKAREVQAAWNAKHPDRLVPWEWIEEAMLAWRAWMELGQCDPERSRAACQRHNEFAAKLPDTLLVEIFPDVTRD